MDIEDVSVCTNTDKSLKFEQTHTQYTIITILLEYVGNIYIFNILFYYILLYFIVFFVVVVVVEI